MRPKKYSCPDDYAFYTEKLLQLESDPELNTVLEIARKMGTPPLQVTSFDARHLEVLSRLIKPHKILEFGTLCGFSSVVLARGLTSNGRLYTVERSEHHAKVATEVFSQLKLNDKIKILQGNGLELLSHLSEQGPFDLIFLDADKENYPKYFEWCVENLTTGGLLLADNVFALGFITTSEDNMSNDALKRIVKGIRDFNKLCADHTSLCTTLIPSGEGLLAAVKIK